MKFNLFLFYIFCIFLNLFLINADTNGIWNNVEDIRGGVLGFDEQSFVNNYTFQNNVSFKDDVFFNNFSVNNVLIKKNLIVNSFFINYSVNLNQSNFSISNNSLEILGKVFTSIETLNTSSNLSALTKGYVDNEFEKLKFLVSNWSIGNWSVCSETCGGGIQNRSVECRTLNGKLIDEKYCLDVSKPVSIQECNTQSCCVTGYGCSECPFGYGTSWATSAGGGRCRYLWRDSCYLSDGVTFASDFCYQGYNGYCIDGTYSKTWTFCE